MAKVVPPRDGLVLRVTVEGRPQPTWEQVMMEDVLFILYFEKCSWDLLLLPLFQCSRKNQPG